MSDTIEGRDMTDELREPIEQALAWYESPAIHRGFGPMPYDEIVKDVLRAHLSRLDPSPEMVERAAKALHRNDYDEDTVDFADQDWDELSEWGKEQYRTVAARAVPAELKDAIEWTGRQLDQQPSADTEWRILHDAASAHLGCSTITDEQVEAAANALFLLKVPDPTLVEPFGTYAGDEQYRTQARAALEAARVGEEQT